MKLDIYGQVRTLQGEKENCPFRYPGQYEDIEMGLYYNRFRYYDPKVGGYVSQDPIGLLGGMKYYAYVPFPLHLKDSFGLSPTHLALFDSGSSVFVPESVLNNVVPKFGQLGRNDGLFVTTRDAADNIEKAANGSIEKLKEFHRISGMNPYISC